MTLPVALAPESSAESLTLAAQKAFLLEGALPIGYGPVSEIAGVSRALVYTHFPAPEDLINGVLDWQVAILDAAGLKTGNLSGSFCADAMACLEMYFEHLVEYGPLIHVVSQDLYMSGKLSRRYTRKRNMLLKNLAGSAMRELRLKPATAMSFVILVASLAEEGARLVRIGAATHAPTLSSVQQSASLMIDGMRPTQL